ncbi:MULTISPECIES: hypothetical protein [Cupriavidus]|uniref:Uncharacterized protein n=2 Tax=Cupriavidus TaxID=106589 RepID=A0A3G8GV30_9BURK|nr:MULTISPECIES: hypothetical protein [Cupriavidus]AZG12087.1 hypothetical protein EHF44_00995 [Cupriavidus pauculus]QBP14398.1 hypothetical protein DDF84_032265 [Cupriavidus metallidurans]
MQNQVMQVRAGVSSRQLREQYPTKGSMPREVVEVLYATRKQEVEALTAKPTVAAEDLLDLDHGARAMVAQKLFWQCDDQARSFLLSDAHHWVRSSAVLAQAEMSVGPAETRAVRDYRMVDGQFMWRWFPMVPGFPGQFVRPEAWIQSHCPDGYAQPEQAHASAHECLTGCKDQVATSLAAKAD